MEYEKVDHFVELDSSRIHMNVREESFEDTLRVDVNVCLLIGEVLKERINEVRQIFHKIALQEKVGTKVGRRGLTKLRQTLGEIDISYEGHNV